MSAASLALAALVAAAALLRALLLWDLLKVAGACNTCKSRLSALLNNDTLGKGNQKYHNTSCMFNQTAAMPNIGVHVRNTSTKTLH